MGIVREHRRLRRHACAFSDLTLDVYKERTRAGHISNHVADWAASRHRDRDRDRDSGNAIMDLSPSSVRNVCPVKKRGCSLRHEPLGLDDDAAVRRAEAILLPAFDRAIRRLRRSCNQRSPLLAHWIGCLRNIAPSAGSGCSVREISLRRSWSSIIESEPPIKSSVALRNAHLSRQGGEQCVISVRMERQPRWIHGPNKVA
ncbi:hypothetical protein ACVMAJ_001059 [Bradyrhizobium sp. USDA 4448]